MRPEDLSREVNRLYWQTDGPVTRLASELGVSRGTFYNHLEPLPAGARCGTCGEPLYFGTRSDRETGEAFCDACGAVQRVVPGASGPTPPPATSEESDESQAAGQSRLRSLLASRPRWLTTDEDDDRRRTQLLVIAVGAAALGLGILYYSRRRS